MSATPIKELKTLLSFDNEVTAGRKKEAFAAAGATSGDLYRVPLDKIIVRPGYNPRIHTAKWEASIEELVKSIAANGFYQHKPLSVVVATVDGAEVLYLEDGHRRYEATKRAIERGLAEIKVVPVIPKDRSANARDRLIDLASSNTGERFTTPELAILAKRFKALGDTDEQVAEALGVTSVYAKQLLTLAGAPAKIWAMVVDEVISATHAIETLRKHKDKALEVLEAAIKSKKEQSKSKDKVVGDDGEGGGKTKVTAKDDPQARRLSAMKRNGPKLFALVDALLKDSKVKLPELHYKPIDTLLFEVMGAADEKPVNTTGDNEDEDADK